MNSSLYIAFVLAAVLLVLSPGPTVLFVTSTSLRRGVRCGLIAVGGSTLAAAFQLAVVVAGLASVLSFAGHWFEWIRWCGVLYLLYLGLAAIARAPASDASEVESAFYPGGFRYFARGFVVTLMNPKTLLFHTAFLPQFVDPSLPELQQMLVLSCSFVVVAGLGDSGWAVVGGRVGTLLTSRRARRLADRVSGSILVAAGVVLASAGRSE